MKLWHVNPWAKAIALTIAMPLFGFVIIGFWWRATFSWEKDYVAPLYWTLFYFLAMCLIALTPVPLLWTIITKIRKKSQNQNSADESL